MSSSSESHGTHDLNAAASAMTTSESHGAISGSRVSAERLAEMLAQTPTYDADKETRVWFRDLRAALTELLSLRSEPSGPVAWQAILQHAIEGNPTIESPEDHVEYLLGCIRSALASPQPGASS